MDTRYILRAAYDNEFERAIKLLVEIVEKQERELQSLKEQIEVYNKYENRK